MLPHTLSRHSTTKYNIPVLSTEDSQICGGSHSTIALSDVLAGSGTDDSTFQQLARNGDLLLEGLELPVDTLSQLPATPPRQRVGSNNNNNPALLSPPASVSVYMYMYMYIHVCGFHVHTVVSTFTHVYNRS